MERKKKGRGRKRGKKKIKMENNKGRPLCDEIRGFPLVLCEHLQIPWT